MATHYNNKPVSPLEIRVFAPIREASGSAAKFIEVTDNLPHLECDPDPLVREYIELRKRRYLNDNVPYNEESQQFFDELPNTRIVLALRDGKMEGGGRIIRKCPGDNFNLNFEYGQFNAQVIELLDKAHMRLDDTNIVDVGGIVAKESSMPESLATIGSRVQQKISLLANEYPYVNASAVASRNIKSVALTIRRQEGMHSIIYPEQTLGEAKVHLVINTNIDALSEAMEQTVQEGKAITPSYFLYASRHGGMWPTINEKDFTNQNSQRMQGGNWKQGNF